MDACSLAAGAKSLAIGGRGGCRTLNPLWDVDPVRAAACCELLTTMRRLGAVSPPSLSAGSGPSARPKLVNPRLLVS